MSNHRNPRATIPKPDNSIDRIRLKIISLEATTHAADQLLDDLPHIRSPADRRTMARLYALVSRSASEATQLLSSIE
jgi:hypothetical protein